MIWWKVLFQLWKYVRHGTDPCTTYHSETDDIGTVALEHELSEWEPSKMLHSRCACEKSLWTLRHINVKLNPNTSQLENDALWRVKGKVSTGFRGFMSTWCKYADTVYHRWKRSLLYRSDIAKMKSEWARSTSSHTIKTKLGWKVKIWAKLYIHHSLQIRPVDSEAETGNEGRERERERGCNKGPWRCDYVACATTIWPPGSSLLVQLTRCTCCSCAYTIYRCNKGSLKTFWGAISLSLTSMLDVVTIFPDLSI